MNSLAKREIASGVKDHQQHSQVKFINPCSQFFKDKEKNRKHDGNVTDIYVSTTNQNTRKLNKTANTLSMSERFPAIEL